MVTEMALSTSKDSMTSARWDGSNSSRVSTEPALGERGAERNVTVMVNGNGHGTPPVQVVSRDLSFSALLRIEAKRGCTTLADYTDATSSCVCISTVAVVLDSTAVPTFVSRSLFAALHLHLHLQYSSRSVDTSVSQRYTSPSFRCLTVPARVAILSHFSDGSQTESISASASDQTPSRRHVNIPIEPFASLRLSSARRHDG